MIAVGLAVPMTGGAVVFAATAHVGLRAAPAPAARAHRHGVRHPASPSRSAGTGPARHASPPAAPTSPAPASPRPDAPAIDFSPYADVLSWPPLDLAKTSTETHVKDFTMGFVSAGDGCSETWGGLSPLRDLFAVRRLKTVPGKVTVAFGGPRGTELAQACTDVSELTDRYRDVVDATHPDGIDLFLTDTDLADTAASGRRAQALARLQHDHPDLPVSITLPLHPSGLSGDGLGMLRAASSAGLDVAIVNVIPTGGDGGASLTSSATAAHGQLVRLYRQGDAQVWRRMGVTPIIGVSGGDTGFQPSDATAVITWAERHGLGRLSMWSITRDSPCTVDTTAANDTCSGLDEDPGVFSKIFQRS
jgi:chitinase